MSEPNPCPAIDPALLTHLKKAFPKTQVLPEYGTSHDGVCFLQGQKKVLDYFESMLKKQNETSKLTR